MSDLKIAKKLSVNLKVYKPELERALQSHKANYSFWSVFPLIIQFMAILGSLLIVINPMQLSTAALLIVTLNAAVWIISVIGVSCCDYSVGVIQASYINLKHIDGYIKDIDVMIQAGEIHLTRLEAMRVQTVAMIAQAAKHDNQRSSLFELVNSNFKPIEVPK